MTPHQKSFRKWLAGFRETCIALGGVADPHEPLRFTFQTPEHGVLNASVHESDYESQKKRGFVEIFLAFETYDTGKVHDTLFGRDFNGYSGKWNITLSGGSLDATRALALRELEMRLDHVKATQRLTIKTQVDILNSR